LHPITMDVTPVSWRLMPGPHHPKSHSFAQKEGDSRTKGTSQVAESASEQV
jgi:hypothetical protein